MIRHLSPATIAKPAGRYSHAVEVPREARWLHISGQVGLFPDGTLAEGFEAQAEQAWRNLIAILKDADMSVADIVRLGYYLTDPAHVSIARAVRDRFIADPAPAATLLIVSSLASPAWLFEIEAVAAGV